MFALYLTRLPAGLLPACLLLPSWASCTCTPRGPQITSSMLSGMQCLIHLQIWGSDVHEDCPKLGPGAMAGLTKLQHLWLAEVCLYEHDTEEGQGLLSQMHYLTNLTCLDLHDSFYVEEEGVPAVAAFSALTASSKLEYLSLRGSRRVHTASSRLGVHISCWQAATTPQ